MSRTEDVVYLQTREARDLSDYIKTGRKEPRPRLRRTGGTTDQPWEIVGFQDQEEGTGNYGTGVSRDQVIAAHDVLVASLQQFSRRADADLAALLATELREAIAEYEALKQRGGKLNFFDLLIRARDLLRGNEVVRRDLQKRFTHIFVDEFQDTEPLQAEVLMLLVIGGSGNQRLAKGPGRPRQAIYRGGSEAGDLPLSSGGCRPLDEIRIAGRQAGGGRGTTDDKLQICPANSELRKCGLCREDGWRSKRPSRPTYVPLSPIRSQILESDHQLLPSAFQNHTER